MRSGSIRRFAPAAVAVLAIAVAAGSAHAQNLDSLRAQYTLPLPQLSRMQLASNVARAAPGSSAGSPSAFGPGWGDVFAGFGFQGRTRYSKGWDFKDAVDGALIAGFGLGNPSKYVGVEVDLTSFGTFYSGFFKRTGVGFKVNRMLSNSSAIAFGVENATIMGGSDVGRSMYGVFSKVVTLKDSPAQPFSSFTYSIGVGNGRFRFEDDVADDLNSVNYFASVGLRISEPVGVLADWTGQDLALGLSLVPFRRIPLVITPAVVDVTGLAGDGARFTVGAGIGGNISSLTRSFH